MARPQKYTCRFPDSYCEPEFLALVELESENFGGFSQANRAVWKQHLQSRGYNVEPDAAAKAERYQRRVAELKAQVQPRLKAAT